MSEMKRAAVGLCSLIAVSPYVVRADDQVLEQKVRLLEQRVAELEARVNRPTTQPVSQLGPIVPGDWLHVSIIDLVGPGVATYRDLHVDEQGMIGMPMVKPIKVGQLTIGKAIEAIVKQYNKENLIQTAQVTVERWEAGARSNIGHGALKTGDFVRAIVVELRGPGTESVINTQIDEQGNIQLPVVGAVKLAGLSEATAGKAIDKAYHDGNIIFNAMATVFRTGESGGL